MTKKKSGAKEPDGLSISPDEVFSAIENDRLSGKLADYFKGKICYESAREGAGLVVRIDEHGNREIGHFVNGEFVPVDS